MTFESGTISGPSDTSPDRCWTKPDLTAPRARKEVAPMLSSATYNLMETAAAILKGLHGWIEIEPARRPAAREDRERMSKRSAAAGVASVDDRIAVSD